jgi:hypothetical protein
MCIWSLYRSLRLTTFCWPPAPALWSSSFVNVLSFYVPSRLHLVFIGEQYNKPIYCYCVIELYIV